MKSCTFIGHRDCPYYIKEKLYSVIEHLILEHDVRTFYVGTHGSFDRCAYTVLCGLESKYDIKIVVVLAYLNVRENNDYEVEKTIFPDELSTTVKRYAIIKRNKYMIKQSEYMVCYVNNAFSNSYKIVKMAKRSKLTLINIGELEI